ncbi:hypothetical protein PSYAC_24903 [Pseudomonas syringae pv. actinidiae str. M302091]|nr:hypothetical protein PSYAC_24903 [Pseudomonas syringae pv. actinidiae str. M302091]
MAVRYKAVLVVVPVFIEPQAVLFTQCFKQCLSLCLRQLSGDDHGVGHR